MKNLMFVFVLLCGLTYSSDVSAQIATNNTSEIWIIDYQGAQSVIPPGVWPFTIGTNPTAGVGVLQATNPTGCNNKFASTGIWISTCSFFTTTVEFTGPIATPFFPPPAITFEFN